MKKKLKVSIVGAGAIVTQYHLPAILENEESVVTSIVDKNENRAKQIAEQTGARYFTSVEDVPGADICLVATPPAVREAVIIPALKKGMNVLCEKPFAYNYAIAQGLAKAAKEAGKKIFVAQSRRFFPNIHIVRSMLQSGVIHSPLKIALIEGGAFNWPAVSNHLASENTSDRGIIHDVGSHLVDLLALFLSDLNVDLTEVKIEQCTVDRLPSVNNCKVKLQWNTAISQGTAVIQMSRTITLLNKLVVHNPPMSLITRPLFDKSVRMKLSNGEELMIPLPEKLQYMQSLSDAFSRQWAGVVHSISNEFNSDEYPSIESHTVLPAIQLLDRIIQYCQVESLDEYFLEGMEKW